MEAQVQLIKQYIDSKTGNVYWRGNYYLSQLPEKIRNDINYVSLDKVLEEKTVKDNKVKNLIEENVKEQTTLNKIELIEKKNKININTCSLEELTSLKGIGETLGNKIIEKRIYNNFDHFKTSFPFIADKIKDNIDV